jgi:WD repeat-containing protein 35
MTPGMTNTTVVDHVKGEFVNFMTKIDYAEEPDIVQVEEFGMHVHADGTVVYAEKIEGLTADGVTIHDENNVSLDNLARLLVDIHTDSSEIMEALLTPVQVNRGSP